MGLDLFLKAKISTKETGEVISGRKYPDDAPPYSQMSKEDKEYFDFEYDQIELCWWCGRSNSYICDEILKICNKASGTDYKNTDYEIPVKEQCLRDIYGFLVKNSYNKKNSISFDLGGVCAGLWNERINLLNAKKLNDILFTLEWIKNKNKLPYLEEYINETEESVSTNFLLNKIYFKNETFYNKFLNDPQNYVWEFIFHNSY